MSRSASRDNSTAVSLFPFLAVLLCTMGALVVLLVVMAQAASRHAELAEAVAENAAEASPPVQTQEPSITEVVPESPALSAEEVEQADAEAAETLRLAREREAKLAELQKQAAEALRDDQTRLSHIEDHIRRLQEQLASLQDAVRELHALETSYQDEQGLAEKELARLEQLIAETEEEIERFEEEQEGKQKSYAIVPFKGVNGTRRRPLYIECRKDKVILQPEGTELEAMDLRPPLGVGNPLSAALRASRKHYQRRNPETAFDLDAAPYPLILVRPDGIDLYHRVREALKSGDSDFGYEMINAEWDLEFGLPDPVLANSQAQAIDAARVRRHLLSRAAPSAYDSPGRARIGTVSGTRGGRGGAPGAGGAPGPVGDQRQGIDSSYGAGSPYSTDDTLQYGEADSASAFAADGRSQTGPASATTQRYGGQPEEGANSYGQLANGAANNDQNRDGNNSGGTAAGGVAQRDGSKTNEGDAASAGGSAEGADSQYAGQAGGQPGGSPGGAPPAGGGASASVSATFDGRQGGGGSGVGGGGRGNRGDIAIRRSISIAVYRDQVVVTPVDSYGRVIVAHAQTVPFNGRTTDHLGDLMAAVRRQVDGWGIAGRGFYWKPVLVLSVGQGGGRRADELVSELSPRGVEVRYQNTANVNQPRGAGAQR